ncbi:MAG: DUF2298 domain-containing protein [Halanaeroarchaeum sp.]
MEIGRVLAWWVVYQALLVVGWPVAAAILPDDRQRGAWLAMPLSLVGILLPVFWVGHATFGLATVLGAFVLWIAVAALVLWRTEFAYDWRRLRGTVAVFTVAFVFLVLLRAAAAGIYPGGGEKFLDFGLLQSLLRSTSLPPADMWFAGEPVRYYYGGHLMAAILATLTGTAGRFAYALALSGFYAMAVTAVYGLASSIAADRSLPRIAAGAFAAFLWGFASNLLTPARLAANLLPASLQSWVAHQFSTRQGGLYYIDPNSVAVTPHSFSYWTASRVIPGTIDEFPLFAFRNGDLHAHMMVVAVTLTVAGVLYAYVRTPAERRRRRLALLFGVLPPLVGTVLFVNTWSFPTVLGLTVLAVALAPHPPSSLLGSLGDRLLPGDSLLGRARGEMQRPVLAIVVAGVVAVLALVWVAPFVGGILLQGAQDRGIGFLPDRSGLGPFLLVHGAFLATFGLVVAGPFASGQRHIAAIVASVPVLVLVGWWTNLVALALVGPLLVAGWYLVRRGRLDFDGILLVAGAGLVVLVEFVYLADNAGPTRFNTVFKVYAQVWTFWAVAGGVALASLVRRAPSSLPITPRRRAAIGQVFVAVLVVSTSLYGAMAMANHFGHANEYTLDGYAYLHDRFPEEAGAIEWLDDQPGQPTIAAAPGYTTYTWENPASSLTGIPTVAGWGHEGIYRGSEAYRSRSRDVEILFETTEARSRAALLRRYEVDYLYYGPREKRRYGRHDYAAEPGISVAFQRADQNVTIYRIDRNRLVD